MSRALEIAARLLHSDDREVMLGDLQEQQQPTWKGLVAILGFAVRQQADYWRDWRPWIVGAAVIPATLLFLGASFRLSLGVRAFWQDGYFQDALLYQGALTILWPWTGGFFIGAISRRTGWLSPLLCAIPCVSCLLNFREPSLSSLSLFLFLPPAILGAMLGRRWMRMGVTLSVILAVATAGVMLLWRGMPAANWLLLLPAVCLAWTSLKPDTFTQEA